MVEADNGSRKEVNSVLVIFVLSLTTLMSSIDTNIVNIGLPTIAKVFGASFASLQWITLSYLLAVTSLIVGIGRIGDIFGKKKIFTCGIVIFTVASLLCGLSTSIYSLIAFRAVQGVGASILMALSFAIVGDLVPKDKLIQSMAILTSMLPIGFALGPSIGGALIGLFGWESIFFLNLPIGILALIFVLKFPKIPISEKEKKLDFLGMGTLTITLIGYVLGITLAEEQGFSNLVIGLLVLAIMGVIIFIFIEKKVEAPLIDLSMFKEAIFSSSLAISVIIYTVITGTILILPFYLQQGKGYSTALSGLLMTVGPVGCFILTPISGQVAKKLGNFTTMILGIGIFTLGIFVMSTLNEYSSSIYFAIIFFLFNGSLALFQTPNNASIISLAKPEQRGLASGLLNLSRTVGQTTGAALIGAIFYFFTGTKSLENLNPSNIATGIHNTFLVETGIMIIGCIIAYKTLMPKRRKSGKE